jgi:hypothetical protein
MEYITIVLRYIENIKTFLSWNIVFIEDKCYFGSMLYY